MEFKSFYQVLLDALKGKRVILRSYDPDDYTQFLNNDTDEADETPKIWDDNGNYLEWSGTVIDILQNDNSHIDIIFDEKILISHQIKHYKYLLTPFLVSTLSQENFLTQILIIVMYLHRYILIKILLI